MSRDQSRFAGYARSRFAPARTSIHFIKDFKRNRSYTRRPNSSGTSCLFLVTYTWSSCGCALRSPDRIPELFKLDTNIRYRALRRTLTDRFRNFRRVCEQRELIGAIGMIKQIPISIFTDPLHLSSRRFSSFMGLLLVQASNSLMISRARAYAHVSGAVMRRNAHKETPEFVGPAFGVSYITRMGALLTT